jgi:hypothetical protein
VDALRVQAATILATPGCECGCGTLTLHPAEAAPRSDFQGQLAGSALFSGEDGEPGGGLLLFVDQGRLATLEVYGYSNGPQAIPDVERVHPERR